MTIDSPAPFAVNENSTELVVTAPLDREESECYRLLLVCTVRTEMVITKVETSLDVFVMDEDDNAPYVNGTDITDVVISFNRTKVTTLTQGPDTDTDTETDRCLIVFVILLQGGSYGTLFVFDRDLTPIYPIDKSHSKYVGTLLNGDSWINKTFEIKGTFSEKKSAQGGIRETVHDYRKYIRL